MKYLQITFPDGKMFLIAEDVINGKRAEKIAHAFANEHFDGDKLRWKELYNRTFDDEFDYGSNYPELLMEYAITGLTWDELKEYAIADGEVKFDYAKLWPKVPAEFIELDG